MNKSPLRYPGGKSRYIKKILPFIPTDKTVVSPFFGGGHIELACLERGQRVIAGDAFFPLVNFWQWLTLEQRQIVHYVEALHKEIQLDIAFSEARTIVQTEGTPWSAANYFLINRCSFSGATLSGGFSWDSARNRFTQSSINRLAAVDVNNLRIRCNDFTETLTYGGGKVFVYADPPYYEIGGLYGKNGDMSFSEDDHANLAYWIKRTQSPFAISYNDCHQVRSLYKGCQFIELAPSKSMSNGKKSCPEILIIG